MNGSQWVIRLSCALALLAYTKAQAAFSDSFDALRAELVSRASILSNSVDKAEIKQYKTCMKTVAAIDKSSTLANDIKSAAKITKSLAKVFTNEFGVATAQATLPSVTFSNNLGILVTGTFSNLAEEVQAALDDLQTAIDGLPDGSTKIAAQDLHDAAQTLIGSDDSDLLAFAKSLTRAVKDIIKGNKIVAKPSGGGIGSNSLTMKVNSSSWKALIASGEYDPASGEFDLGGVSKHPESVLTVTVPSGVTGPGTYSLPAGLTFYITKTDVYQNTGGSLTITTLDVAGQTATGTFSFTGNPIGGGAPVNITNGAFTINDLTAF